MSIGNRRVAAIISAERCIGRFELAKELGRGAQGSVFLARDLRLEGLVELKTLRSNGGAAQPADRVRMLLDEARIMDFGIACRAAGEKLSDSALYGTPYYMSPEYIATQAYLPGSDVFSLAVLLYELLTGAPPVNVVNVYEVMPLHLCEIVWQWTDNMTMLDTGHHRS